MGWLRRFWEWLMPEVQERPRICSCCDRPLVPMMVDSETIWSCENCDGVVTFRKEQSSSGE